MAHDLNIRADGTAAMFSLRESPWHKLGRVLTTEITDDKVAEAAGLNWTVLEKPIYHETNGTYDVITGEKALVRSDTNQVMSVVSKEYRVFQNQELIELMKRIASNTPVVWETAGCLGRTGQTQWVMGYLPDLDIKVREKDSTKSYMLLTNGHGNMRSLQVLPTTVRVVCQNTLSMATQGGDRKRRANMKAGKFDRAALSTGYGIHHDGSLDKSVEDVVSAYERFMKDKIITQEIYEQMADTKMSRSDTVEYWNRVFGMPSAEEHDEAAKLKLLENEKKRQTTLESILTSVTCQTDASNGTLYGSLQSVVEYVDHFSLRRKANASSQLNVSQFGAGAKVKEKAFDEAMAVVAA